MPVEHSITQDNGGEQSVEEEGLLGIKQRQLVPVTPLVANHTCWSCQGMP